jgi:hypothetical protein
VLLEGGNVVLYNCSLADIAVNYATDNFGHFQAILLIGVLVLSQSRKLRHITTRKII